VSDLINKVRVMAGSKECLKIDLEVRMH